VTITGNLRAVNETHAFGDAESGAGVVTLATFSLGEITFGSALESDDIAVRIEIDEAGFSVRFFDLSAGTEIVPFDVTGTLTDLSWDELTSIIDVGGTFETIALSDELDNVFFHTFAQATRAGRGYVEFDRLTVMEVAPAALPGDYNSDGTVSGADYVVWANTFGNDGSPGKEDLRADGNGDGAVTGADYVIWANNFGATAD